MSLGLSFFAPHAPDCSLFYPVPVRSLRQDLPRLVAGTTAAFDHSSAWWLTSAMMDYVHGRWDLVIERVREVQAELENASHAFLIDLHSGEAQARVEAFQEHMVESFWVLYWQLHAEFQSGEGQFGTRQIGYPRWVLEASHYGAWATSYPGDPLLPRRFHKLNHDLAAAQAWTDAQLSQGPYRRGVVALSVTDRGSFHLPMEWFLVTVFVLLLSFVFVFGVGLALGRSGAKKQQSLLG